MAKVPVEMVGLGEHLQDLGHLQKMSSVKKWLKQRRAHVGWEFCIKMKNLPESFAWDDCWSYRPKGEQQESGLFLASWTYGHPATDLSFLAGGLFKGARTVCSVDGHCPLSFGGFWGLLRAAGTVGQPTSERKGQQKSSPSGRTSDLAAQAELESLFCASGSKNQVLVCGFLEWREYLFPSGANKVIF